jgi:hypothetical protein
MYTDLMLRVRRIGGPVAAIWLLLQTATLVVVPAVFYASSSVSPLECTCVHDGNHRDCPMHHASPIGGRICFQTTDSTGFTALGSLLGHLGVVPRPADTLLLNPPPLAVQSDAPAHHRTLAPPAPPPPRA